MKKNSIITVQNTPITVLSMDSDDYICITDMAAAKAGNVRAADVIKNWLRNRITLEYLGTWKQLLGMKVKLQNENVGFKTVEENAEGYIMVCEL